MQSLGKPVDVGWFDDRVPCRYPCSGGPVQTSQSGGCECEGCTESPLALMHNFSEAAQLHIASDVLHISVLHRSFRT